VSRTENRAIDHKATPGPQPLIFNLQSLLCAAFDVLMSRRRQSI
jgi:hypothetical protein